MIMKNEYPAIDRKRTGAAIRMYMDRKELSVEDVRRYLKLGAVQSIYHWLEGITLPSVDNLYALSVLLEVPVDRLLRGNYEHFSPSSEEYRQKRIGYYAKRLENAA